MDKFVSLKIKELLNTKYAICVYKIIGMYMDFNKSYNAYIYFKTASELCALTEEKKNKIESVYIGYLRQHGYMPNEIEKIEFHFDSDENVQKKYKGNYFYAIR